MSEEAPRLAEIQRAEAALRYATALVSDRIHCEGPSYRERLREFVQVLGTLSARLQQQEAQIAAMRWQPIETAPKDGRAILGYTPYSDVLMGDVFYSQDLEQWLRLPLTDAVVRPTHWMPLPSPPDHP